MSSTTNPRVTLIDKDGDVLDDGSGNLNVTVSSLDTQPATFNTVVSVKLDTADDTNWHQLPNNGGKEVLIQSLSTNVDTIYLGDYVNESSEIESIELFPATSVSLAISNTNILSYKKVTHGAINQYLLITILKNV